MNKIIQNQSIITLSGNSRIVIHLIPEYSINSIKNYDLKFVREHCIKYLRTMNCDVPNIKWWEKGLLILCGNNNEKTSSYVNIFDNGIIEAVESKILHPTQKREGNGNILYIKKVEKTLIRAIERFTRVQNEINVSLPINIYLSLLNIKGYYIPLGLHYGVIKDKSQKIKRQNLNLPKLEMNYFNADVGTLLKPAFDYVWRACGEPENLDYDDEKQFNFR